MRSCLGQTVSIKKIFILTFFANVLGTVTLSLRLSSHSHFVTLTLENKTDVFPGACRGRNRFVFHVSKEASPLASFGGVGQVVGELTSALSRDLSDACLVTVIPKYGFVEATHTLSTFDITIGTRVGHGSIYHHYLNGVNYILIGNPSFYPLLWSSTSVEDMYNCPQGVKREDRDMYFNYVAAKIIAETVSHNVDKSVVHAHGASNAPVLWFLRQFTKKQVSLVYTIHDYNSETKLTYSLRKIAHFSGAHDFQIARSCFAVGTESKTVSVESKSSVLATFFVSCADAVTTVSSGMVQPLKQLDSTYADLLSHFENTGRLFSIRNWVSQSIWDDAREVVPLENTLSGKLRARENLFQMLHAHGAGSMPRRQDAICLVGWIGRFDTNKGIVFLPALVETVCNLECLLVVVGYSTSRRDKKNINAVKKQMQKWSLANSCTFMMLDSKSMQSGQMRTIRAALDIVVVSSLSEGFGLTAAEALAFGSIPVVSSVGGLPEVVKPFDGGVQSGVVFEILDSLELSIAALQQALTRAVSLYVQSENSGMLASLHFDLISNTPLRESPNSLPAYITLYDKLATF